MITNSDFDVKLIDEGPAIPTALQQQEVLLKPNPQRFVLFPIKYNGIWKMYKQHEANFWTTEEMDLSNDMADWVTLSSDEQHFIKHVLAFFAASDGIVLENLAQQFIEEVQIPEARAFYGFQLMMESIHAESYCLLIDTYIKDTHEKAKLFNAIEHIPAVQRKAQWALKWINKEKSFAERLFAFALVEGVFFSGSFCAIYWLKKRGLMPGLAFANRKISEDEGLHFLFACLLYSMLTYKLSHETVEAITREAVLIEKEFICDALPVSLIGMSATAMCQYIEYVTDRALVELGYKKIYNAQNPFEWMEAISLQAKVNMFEERNGDYQKAGVMATADQQAFTLEADF